MDDLLNLLAKQADTLVVGIVFVLCQGVKRILPSPPASDPAERTNAWAVMRELSWVPFVCAFLFGTIGAIALSAGKGLAPVEKIRAGLATGAYSVAIWELWSNGKKFATLFR